MVKFDIDQYLSKEIFSLNSMCDLHLKYNSEIKINTMIRRNQNSVNYLFSIHGTEKDLLALGAALARVVGL